MRIVIFGANGPTGRLLTRQAIDADHDVVAVTRQPENFPLAHQRLNLTCTDVHDRPGVAQAVKGAHTVLSAVGTPFTRAPITVYSDGIASITAAMAEHGVRRIVAVSSSAAEPHHHADGGFLLNHVLQPVIVRTIGKTTYADMRAMERQLVASDLDWTIVRPSGLFDARTVSAYALHEDRADGIFTSRADLAACLLDQTSNTDWLHKKVAITTHDGTPGLRQMMWREAVGR